MLSDRELHSHDVLGKKQRAAALVGGAFDERDRLVGFAGGHARGRLVEQENLRVARKRNSELELFLIAVGERPGGRSRLAGKSDRAEQPLALVAAQGLRARPEIP